MAFEYKDVLAGPIIRRVERRLASVWIALRKPAAVKLSLWEGAKDGDVSSGTELISGSADTISVGAELHLALVVATLPDNPTQQLKSDTLYSYDLEIKEAGATSGQRLLQLGLLGEADSKGGKCPEALGYKNRRLPAFALPPSDIGKLHLLQGSCRMPHNEADDAMAAIDDLLKKDDAFQDPLKRPHQLFLTGDQIYADELAVYYLELVNRVANRLLTGSDTAVGEYLPIEHNGQTHQVPLTCGLFPPGRRQRLIRKAGLSSGSGDSHVLGFGEFAALYLLGWAETLWPADFFQNALNEHKARIASYVSNRATLMTMLGQHSFGEDKRRKQAEAKLDYYEGWRLLKPEWRAIDQDLQAADHAADWGTENLDGFIVQDPPDTLDEVAGSPAHAAGVPVEVRRALAKNLTPSWFAGARELGFSSEVEGGLYLDRGLTQLRGMQSFRKEIAKVRRALANIPTYMTFDDHEVTDDWNISQNWIDEVNGNPLGVAVLRNGLLSFGLFQAWGNDPLYFQGSELTPGKRLLEEAVKLFPQPKTTHEAAATALNRMFHIAGTDAPVADRVRWHYRIGGPGYEVLSLDTRTFRGFKEPDGPPELTTLAAIQDQIPENPVYSYGDPPAGQGMTFVIAAAPVLGFPPVEYIVQPLTNTMDRLKKLDEDEPFVAARRDYFTGAVDHDPEPWAYHDDIVEALLARLAAHKRVAFLSGDVHYACAVKLDYWRFNGNGGPEATRFLQLTASAFKNYTGKFKFSLFRHGLVSRLTEVIALPRERLAWENTDSRGAPISPPNGASFNNLIRRRLDKNTALIPVKGLPPGTRQNYAPSWGWRLDLLKDARTDAERFPGVAVPAFKPNPNGFDGEFVHKLGARHVWQSVHGNSAVVSFVSNLGRITMDTGGAAPRLNFALHFQLTDLPAGGVKPFLGYSVPLNPDADDAPPKVPTSN